MNWNKHPNFPHLEHAENEKHIFFRVTSRTAIPAQGRLSFEKVPGINHVWERLNTGHKPTFNRISHVIGAASLPLVEWLGQLASLTIFDYQQAQESVDGNHWIDFRVWFETLQSGKAVRKGRKLNITVPAPHFETCGAVEEGWQLRVVTSGGPYYTFSVVFPGLTAEWHDFLNRYFPNGLVYFQELAKGRPVDQTNPFESFSGMARLHMGNMLEVLVWLIVEDHITDSQSHFYLDGLAEQCFPYRPVPGTETFPAP